MSGASGFRAGAVRTACEHTFVWDRAIVDEVLRLSARGMTAAEIARRTGVPRRTVDWVGGRAPRPAISTPGYGIRS